MRRWTVVLALLLTAALAVPAAAAPSTGSDVIEVFPGPNAINNALDVAQAGDVLLIHAGIYREKVTVDVPDLTLMNAGDGRVTIDGECSADITLAIRAEGVTIQGLRVVGAGGGFSPIEIDFRNIDRGAVIASRVEDTCGDALYGINVYLSGSIRLIRNRASGFSDAGLYIGDISATPFGPLVLRDNESFGNFRGIILEDLSGSSIRVISNYLHDNDTGIWYNFADDTSAQGNLVTDNGVSGIEVNDFSDGNLVRGNTALGNGVDLVNGSGSGNCFIHNDYETSDGDISC